MTDPQASGDALVSELADEPDLIELVQAFVGDLPDRLTAIERTLAEETFDDLARLARQLKGAAGGYGFPLITNAAGRLESCVKAGVDLDELRVRAADLALLCQRANATAAEP